jgi:hypothetical protein
MFERGRRITHQAIHLPRRIIAAIATAAQQKSPTLAKSGIDKQEIESF